MTDNSQYSEREKVCVTGMQKTLQRNCLSSHDYLITSPTTAPSQVPAHNTVSCFAFTTAHRIVEDKVSKVRCGVTNHNPTSGKN